MNREARPSRTMTEIEIAGLAPFASGKVREVFCLGDFLLFVATDRISAFDVVLPTPIPGKGRVLTQLSKYWLRALSHIIPNHHTERSVREFLKDPQVIADLEDRSMIVRKAEPLKIEAIVRGYLAGSAWPEYQQTGSVGGIELPKGLPLSGRLPEPIFTPSTKAPVGAHDVNISFEQVCGVVGPDLARKVRDTSVALYTEASHAAAACGIIIADTKFEFGLIKDEVVLIDEVFTPDSSRFWDVRTYEPGRNQPSFDKQYVRDWLDSVGWDRKPPAPELPADVVAKTSEKYAMALVRLTSPQPQGRAS